MMSDGYGGAYELEHRGRVYRVPGFVELKKWIIEGRVLSEDRYRKAGTEEWLPVTAHPEFKKLLSPDALWKLSMSTGTFTARSFDTIVKWAKEGRISEDAVVEGPRTPPGGIKASALPALSPYLKPVALGRTVYPVLRIDGREFQAPDTATIRRWIRESRVPVEAEISIGGKEWEPVSSCGLFDLEDWPRAAHGLTEEEELPEMPRFNPEPFPEAAPVSAGEQEETEKEDAEEETVAAVDGFMESEAPEEEDTENVPFVIVSANSELTVETLSEIKSLLKKKTIYSYDEIRHPSIREEGISVGEYLDSIKSGRKGRMIVPLVLLLAVVALAALEYTGTLDLVTWL